VLISDTVGFIRNLPHDLIESFKSTLAEVIEADILLHVVDISSESYEDQILVVEETLKDIGADTKPVIMVFNKVDKLNEHKQEIISSLKGKYPDSVFISAYKGINLGALFDKIIDMMHAEIEELEIRIPSSNPEAYRIINRLHQDADIVSTKYLSKDIKLIVKGNKNQLKKILSGLHIDKELIKDHKSTQENKSTKENKSTNNNSNKSANINRKELPAEA
jgi:GTP-binding protein HflX